MLQDLLLLFLNLLVDSLCGLGQKHCGTHEHKKRLKGVYSLCKRKVSSSSRASSSGKLHLKKGRSAGNEGLAALGRIIQRLDLES